MTRRKKDLKHKMPKLVLRLPDREQAKRAVLNALAAGSSQESYGHAIDEFIGWYSLAYAASRAQSGWEFKLETG